MPSAEAILDRLATKAGQLYSLPAVAMQVIQLTNNPEVDTHRLKECIENDPALTGKILRVVNSSLFGLSREVSDLNQALALLGTKPLKLLVLGFSLPAGLFSGLSGEVLGRYWRGTLTKAVAAREISQALFHMPGDDAFIAGLLQDLGQLLLIQELGTPYVTLLQKVGSTGQDLIALEQKSMGFDHAMLSARMLDHWGLPEVLVEGVAWKSISRRQGGARPTVPLPQILELADLLARLLIDRQCDLLGEVFRRGQEYAELSEDQLKSLVENLQEKVEQLADVLSQQLPAGTDYRDVLIEAYQQLSQVAGQAAETLLSPEARGREDDSLLAEIQGLSAMVAEISQRPAASRSRPQEQPQPAEPAVAVSQAEPPPSAADRSLPTEAHPGLFRRLGVAAEACRRSRRPLSLLLAQFDRSGEFVTLPDGTPRQDDLQASVDRLCRLANHPGVMHFSHGETGLAVVLPNCERRQAVELGNRLIAEFRRPGQGDREQERRSNGLSVGISSVALPPKNFPAQNLFDAAERCLYGSHASGGGVVKSIEIY